MTNYQIISGFVCAQEKLLRSRQATSFYATKKALAFNTNYLYVKEGNAATLKPIAKTYFTHASGSCGYALHFDLIDETLLSGRQKGYIKELKRQIINKYYSGSKRDERITIATTSNVIKIVTDVPLLDIIEATAGAK